ncbi:MAG: DUF1573 domain-containing protein [Bacteroidales bacterium]|nr:DUF1573 domain-containing protein [Bacteroidales bacterium]
MKKISTLIIVFFALFITASINPSIITNEGSLPHIKFDNTSFDFGKIQQNGDGNYSFKFENTGKEPLIIQNVRSSCGCTVAKRPTAPILPGESSEISVKYDTRRIGRFHKNITITSNADNKSVILHVKGEVIAKPKEEVPVKKVNKGFTPVAG